MSDQYPIKDPDILQVHSRREAWREQRRRMEASQEKSTPTGFHKKRHWALFKELVALFGVGLRLLGFYERGLDNALDLRLRNLEFGFASLPPEFDGFRILQLSDFHFDMLPGTTEKALELISDLDVDLCVLTGDYRKRVSGPFTQILPEMEKVIARLSPRHGVFAILGNHDCADMVEAFERLGIRVLVNETCCLRRGGGQLYLCGIDDVHYYYTEAARAALEGTPDGFKIALVHSAEIADVAAACGFNLYLSGHTHGGQVCLPGGRPIITHMSRYRRYASGLWQHGDMHGYTTTGIGVSGLPVRFNNRGEVVLITLRRGAP